MSTRKKNEVNFSLVGVELLKASLNHPETAIPPQMNFQYDVTVEHRFRLEEELFLIFTNVDVTNEDKTSLMGSVKTSCVYRINDLKSYIEKEANTVNLPIDIIDALNSISISTSRGIMYSYFRGTFLHNAHLPLVDPKQLRPSSKK